MSLHREFLQSEQWIAFQEATGKKSIRFTADSFLAYGIIHTVPLFGRYVYVPRGPILDTETKNVLREFIDVAKHQGARWIRIEPETTSSLTLIQKHAHCRVSPAPHDVQPREVLRLDMTPSEEALFSAMKPKTRYNIRLAEKRGVRVFVTREEKHVSAFLDLVRKTANRKSIIPHPPSYYKQLLHILPEDMCHLFIAEYAGEVLCANILITFGTTATYLHGGSSDIHRDMMAPYLLQWEQIKFAKQAGCALYDFGGVSGEGTHSWSGITKFKMGFAPDTPTVVFPGAYDIILNSMIYTLYRGAVYCKQKIKQTLQWIRC